jgi:hypothetical protein
MIVSNKERKAFAAAAQSFGLRYAVPLKRFYLLGAKISCAMNVLERSGL